MDISVSRLNGRLALKLPPELPLGLVFVVGKVAELGSHDFVLTEETHRLTCRADEALPAIAVGDEVRVSGHLMFDDRQLQYFLRARDIERVSSEPLGFVEPRERLPVDDGLLTALEKVKARATAANVENQEALPIWVKKLAPLEAGVVLEEGEEDEEDRRRGLAEGELDAKLVAMLSEAMDSEKETELTPELLAPFLPPEPDLVEGVAEDESVEMETAVSQPALSTSYRPANRKDTDWLVIVLILSFFILTIAAVVAIILLLVQ